MTLTKKFLKTVPLFDGADLDITRDLLKDCPIKILEPKTLLIERGDTNKNMYLLLEGELSIHIKELENPPAAQLRPGDCVGEVALLDNKPRSAHVVTTVQSKVLEITQDFFWTLLNSSHEITLNLLLILTNRLRGNNETLSTSFTLQKKFRTAAMFDGLTGLHNRRWINENLPRQITRAQMEKTSLTACMIDIDFFKTLNDTFGHPAGDFILAQLAKRFTDLIRPMDFSARYGGEEFLLVFSEQSSQESFKLAERIRKGTMTLDLTTPDEKKLPQITISIGITQLKQNETMNEFIERADKALYQAKNHGRNRTIELT